MPRRRTSRSLLLLLAAKVSPLTGNTAGIVGKTFCAKGLPSSTNDYDICCARSCGMCVEHGCRTRTGGPLNCCPISGILASGETCVSRTQESCAVKRPASQSISHKFRHFLKGETPAGTGPVDVVVAGDHVHYVGLVAAASSVFATADNPDRIRLHVLAEEGPDLAYLRKALECSLGPPKALNGRRLDDERHLQSNATDLPSRPVWNLRVDHAIDATPARWRGDAGSRRWHIVTFVAEDHFPKNLTIRAPNNAQKGNLAADLNYARFYLTSLLPGVEKVVYLDADTIVNKDISKLYDSALKDSDAVLAAVPRDGKDVCYSLIDCEDPVIAQVLKEEGFPNPATDLNFFNAGVAVFHLGRWAQRGLTRKVEFWIQKNNEIPLYALGSNPPLILGVGTKFERIDPKWNCFGYKKPVNVDKDCQLDAGVRHWSGHLKPWRRDGKYKHYFYEAVPELNCLLELPRQPLEYEPLEIGDIEVEEDFVSADRVPKVGEAVLGPIALGEVGELGEFHKVSSDREYKSIQAVEKSVSLQLKRYGERADDLKSARNFVHQIRTHPSVSWDHIRNRSKGGEIICADVDHVVIVVHNGTLFVDTAQYGVGKPCGPRANNKALAVLRMIRSGRAIKTWPDTIFILCVHPLGTTWGDVPILSFVKTRGDAQPGVLVPGPHFGKANMVVWDRQIRRYEEAVQRYPWTQRIESLYWRGRMVGLDQHAHRNGADEHLDLHVGKISPCDDVANLARLEAVSATLRDEANADMRLNQALRDIPYVFGPEGGGCAPRWDSAVDKRVRDVVTKVQKKLSMLPEPVDGHRKGVNPDSMHRLVKGVLDAPHASMGRMMAHKYVASLPAVGGAAPPSRSEVWYYGAAVLLWRSDVQEWYYPALREGITHVTIDSHNVARTVVELKKDDKAARRMAIEARNVHENHLCPSCLLEHWTYVLTKYNSRFGLRFLDLPATLALLDAKARGEVAVGV